MPDLGAIEGANDGAAEFGMRARLRHEAQKAFAHQDSSRRVQTALLRKSVQMPGIYNVGDFVYYHKLQGNSGLYRWIGPCRIIGFEGDTVRLLSAGVPVCTAAHLLRPASPEEVLARQALESRGQEGPASGEGADRMDNPDDEQVGFVDERPRTRRRLNEAGEDDAEATRNSGTAEGTRNSGMQPEPDPSAAGMDRPDIDQGAGQPARDGLLLPPEADLTRQPRQLTGPEPEREQSTAPHRPAPTLDLNRLMSVQRQGWPALDGAIDGRQAGAIRHAKQLWPSQVQNSTPWGPEWKTRYRECGLIHRPSFAHDRTADGRGLDG